MSMPDSIVAMLVDVYWELRPRVDVMSRGGILDDDEKMRIAAEKAYDEVHASLSPEDRARLDGDGRDVAIAILVARVKAS